VENYNRYNSSGVGCLLQVHLAMLDIPEASGHFISSGAIDKINLQVRPDLCL
jgi:hypothetical protein